MTKVFWMKCEYLRRGWAPCCLIAALFGWVQGCASLQTVSGSSSFVNSSFNANSYHPVLEGQGKNRQQPSFEGRLPLGIGTRFDLFIADTASGMSDFYSSYIEPYRSGKLFSRQPYALDYSILPRKGAAFQSRGSMIESVTIKSDYKFQIGMSRNFRELSDFLNPNFWLARGKFCTAPPNKESAVTLQDLQMKQLNEEDRPLDLNCPQEVELNQLLDERWGLAPDDDQ